MNSKVSVIIPAYNAAETIERCIQSLLKQSYKSIEIIVVDDGSTDSTGSIITSIYKGNCKVIYITKENQGVSVARNVGMSIATGKYIMFVDADDWIHTECIGSMVETLEAQNADYCFTDWYVKTNEGLRIDYVNKDFKEKFSAEILYRFYILNRYGCAPWGKLYKRDLIVKNEIAFSPELPYAEDYLFILQYLSYADTCVYVKKPLLYYDCCQPGAAVKIRDNYFNLQVKIECLKEKIVMSSIKYRNSDKDLLRISKLQAYVLSLIYLKNLYKNFNSCYREAKKILKVLRKECSINLLKYSNLNSLGKVYAVLAFLNNTFGIVVLTIITAFVKKLVRR
ncbi:hypothetical protein CHN50_17285 [Priestia aryabhattai]|nr:hypothetical protein CHN50_17285 [Priestia aryabhattai]